MHHLTCIAIDDDNLFLKCIETYVKSIDWLTLLGTHNNPVQGATAILTQKPDLVILDVEMPYMKGDNLMDWIQPSLMKLERPPEIIVVSFLSRAPEAMLRQAKGFINKSKITSAENLATELKILLHEPVDNEAGEK